MNLNFGICKSYIYKSRKKNWLSLCGKITDNVLSFILSAAPGFLHQTFVTFKNVLKNNKNLITSKRFKHPSPTQTYFY